MPALLLIVLQSSSCPPYFVELQVNAEDAAVSHLTLVTQPLGTSIRRPVISKRICALIDKVDFMTLVRLPTYIQGLERATAHYSTSFNFCAVIPESITHTIRSGSQILTVESNLRPRVSARKNNGSTNWPGWVIVALLLGVVRPNLGEQTKKPTNGVMPPACQHVRSSRLCLFAHGFFL